MKNGNSLIHHFLERSARSTPDSVAVVDGKRRATYGSLNRLANQLAHSLREAGVKPGDRVAMLCENNTEYVFGYYGVLKTGAVVATLNTELKPPDIEELLGEMKPKALIISSKFEPFLQTLDPSRLSISRLLIHHQRQSWTFGACSVSSTYEALSSQSDRNPDLNVDPHSCAEIIYSSGSTGKARGVMLSHANILANTQSIIEYLKLTSHDVQMVVLPFFYVMGKSLLNTHIAAGGRLILNNQFAYTASVLKQMAKEGVTGFSGVPSTYARLLFKSPLARYRDRLPALRYCSQAGGHMPKHVKLELLDALPSHTKLYVMYGATEASARLTYLPPKFLREKIDSIGIPIPGVKIKILSAEGEVLKSGEIGEIVAQGENIMMGYYLDDESTRRVLDQRGYHTGDLGYCDEEGFLFVTGRKDDQLKVEGHRIQPREIEDVIMDSGYAYECVVFGIPGRFSGHRLAGLVVPLNPTPDLMADILRYCRQRLPKYKVPESLGMVDAIPKNANGKPDRIQSVRLFNLEYNETRNDESCSSV